MLMVKLVPAYAAFADRLRSSAQYHESGAESRRIIDAWLDSAPVKKYFSGLVVPQLDLAESFEMGIRNSPAFLQRPPYEQQQIAKYIGSGRFRKIVNRLERALTGLF